MTIATTGQDVVEETRAFNARMARILGRFPPLHKIDDVALARSGDGPYPSPPLLAEGRDRTLPGRAGGVPVRVFTPPAVRGVYLFLHAGGRVVGSAAHQDQQLWDLARGAGVAVVAVDYRLAPENPHPAAPDDCEDAARWLVEHARSEFGTDRLVIGGESSGAELAVRTLLRLRDTDGSHRAFRGAYLAYGFYDASLTPSARSYGEDGPLLTTPVIRWMVGHAFPGMSPEELRDPAVSPLYADLHDLPRARFVVGTRDPALDDTTFMAARWGAAGNETDLEVVAEAVHGFTMFPIKVAERELERGREFVAGVVG
ncbi:alpha/beta hydrolase [Streptomyces luteireticuli]